MDVKQQQIQRGKLKTIMSVLVILQKWFGIYICTLFFWAILPPLSSAAVLLVVVDVASLPAITFGSADILTGTAGHIK